MSITRISIRGFQSLKQVDLDLGLFTVIVGPSSSGKSALIRAFRALASNVRGTGVITRGQKQMAITATLDPNTVVTLERGDRASAYRLRTDDGEMTFTKLAGEVPEQITQALRLDPGTDSVNFAGQFDKPYLLDESGATVARQLAELTNVNQIFEAVRSANKIRASALTTVRTRQGDLEQIKKDLTAFTGLSERLNSFEVLQGMDEARKALQSRLGRLETATRALRTTESALVKYRPVDLPDATPLTAIHGQLLDLTARVNRLKSADIEATKSAALANHHVGTVEKFEQILTAALTEAGVCPTCGQQVP